MADLLSLENINVYYGNIHAIKNVSFHVQEGEIVTLIGANGAGKSTTLATIAGLMRSRTGSIVFGGENISRLPASQMIRRGLVEEVSGLLAKGYDENLPSMSAIGYKEICGFLHGRTSLDEAAQLIKFRTHNYVRRQANWFKPSDPAIRWIDPEDIESVLPELRERIR